MRDSEADAEATAEGEAKRGTEQRQSALDGEGEVAGSGLALAHEERAVGLQEPARVPLEQQLLRLLPAESADVPPDVEMRDN